MVASSGTVRLEEMAQDLFEVITQFSLTLPRGRRRGNDLKEVEFLTLAALHQQGTMIVGDIQRLLGVLPAQMSRIIRALEARDRPFIHCKINPEDKRKINVCLTPAGERALTEYESQRVRGIADRLRRLSETEQEDMNRLLDRLQSVFDRGGMSVKP
jgi:DNA-binding MarR family transcriptional regulator